MELPPRRAMWPVGARFGRSARGLLVSMRGILAVIGTAAIVLSGCGGEDRRTSEEAPSSAETSSASTAPSESDGPATDAETPTEQARRGVVVKTADSAYGPMLFDRSGQAIYLFDKETTSKPECYGACAEAWPPVLAQGIPQASGSVQSPLLGTTLRKDDSRQVTYDGHPLYFYADEGKKEVTCHNVSEFGGLWLVVTPDGKAAA